MNELNHRKRVYYTPGIIGLTILPFIFIHYAHQYNKPFNTRAVQVIWPNFNLPKIHPELFTSYRGHFPPQRSYIPIELAGDEQSDKTKLAFAQLTVRKLVKENDTLQGVHFIFDNQSRYWSLVKAIDILKVEQAKTFMPYRNNLWFYNLPPY